MSKTITIHHYEDEPATMSWLPGALLNHYWDRHPDFVVKNGEFHEEEDKGEARFTATPPGGSVTIQYRVYSNKEDFDRNFKAFSGDVVLLDVMEVSLEGGLVPHGIGLYRQACDAIGTERVYFITAYPRSIPEAIRTELGPQQIIIKPPDVVELCARLLTILGLGENDNGPTTGE